MKPKVRVQLQLARAGLAAVLAVAGNAVAESGEPVGYQSLNARYRNEAKAAPGQMTKAYADSASIDFTALDANGKPTTPTSGAIPHHCVRDNVTNLVWEVKTADGGLRDQKWSYTWYDSNPLTNGGFAGSVSGTTHCKTTGRCDTEKFVADVNAARLCGFTDWRMPTLKELKSIVVHSRVHPPTAIEPTYFPNTPAAVFWSASIDIYGSYYAWGVGFGYGSPFDYRKNGSGRVRLVRADKVIE